MRKEFEDAAGGKGTAMEVASCTRSTAAASAQPVPPCASSSLP